MRASAIAIMAMLALAEAGAGTPAAALPSTVPLVGIRALSAPLLLPARHHHHRHHGRRAWRGYDPAEPLPPPGDPSIGSSQTPATVPAQRYPESGNQAPPAIRWVNPGPSGR